jgi:hypothetical protein
VDIILLGEKCAAFIFIVLSGGWLKSGLKFQLIWFIQVAAEGVAYMQNNGVTMLINDSDTNNNNGDQGYKTCGSISYRLMHPHV